MELFNQLFESATFASVMALAALLLSIFSFVWTKRSAKTSLQAFDESVKNNNRHKESDIAQKRYELLKAFSGEIAMVQQQLTLIETLKADYETSSDAVKKAMGVRVKLFTETLPMIEKHKEEIELSYLNATNWHVENGVPQLLKLQTEQDAAIVHTQGFIECNASLITGFREQLLREQQSTK